MSIKTLTATALAAVILASQSPVVQAEEFEKVVCYQLFRQGYSQLPATLPWNFFQIGIKRQGALPQGFFPQQTLYSVYGKSVNAIASWEEAGMVKGTIGISSQIGARMGLAVSSITLGWGVDPGFVDCVSSQADPTPHVWNCIADVTRRTKNDTGIKFDLVQSDNTFDCSYFTVDPPCRTAPNPRQCVAKLF